MNTYTVLKAKYIKVQNKFNLKSVKYYYTKYVCIKYIYNCNIKYKFTVVFC